MTIINMVGGGGGTLTAKKFAVAFSYKVGSFTKSFTTSSQTSVSTEYISDVPDSTTFLAIQDPSEDLNILSGSIQAKTAVSQYLRSTVQTDTPDGIADAVSSLKTSLTALCNTLQPTESRPLYAYLTPFHRGTGYYQGQFYWRTLPTSGNVQVKLYFDGDTLTADYSTPGKILKYQIFGDYLSPNAVTTSFSVNKYWYLSDLQFPE